MPGVVVFRRRWAVGSDDLIVPGVFLLVIHLTWLLVLMVVLVLMEERDWLPPCMTDLYEHTVGYVIILVGCSVIEACIAHVSMRGSILDDRPRTPMQYLLYVRLGLFVVEVVWLAMGILWIRSHYDVCPSGFAKQAVMGITITNWFVLFIAFLTLWCTFDSAGRSWVIMRKYQNSLSDPNSKYQYRRSGNSHRNWRHRRAVREYQNSWNRRCRFLFCCLGRSERQENSFAEIAKLLSEFFRDLDVVPSDIVAGVILVRKIQRIQRQVVINKSDNSTYRYLSGVRVTPSTKFLDIGDPRTANEIENLVHYLHYAASIYGWPIFVMMNHLTGCCQLCPYLRCSNCVGGNLLFASCTKCCRLRSQPRRPSLSSRKEPLIIGDNCCGCNNAALEKLCETHDFELVYVSYHVGIGEPPFFVAVDHEKKTIVVSVRGTLSLQDVITDLNAEGDFLPTTPRRDNWLGHKGMVEAAIYINKQLMDRDILYQAFCHSVERGTSSYDLVLVGHSLGAGTVSILAIMLREKYPKLHCYAFAPPGGLLSLPAIEYSKEFITSVVLGKDAVPRLGLHQMESLRFDLINAMKHCQEPKWKVISESFACSSCCRRGGRNMNVEQSLASVAGLAEVMKFLARKEKELSAHPQDDTIALTVHQPLYPPGKIVHIVRNHPRLSESGQEQWRENSRKEPVYQALWADNKDFDEILISPVMIQDHMPDKILNALEKLLVHMGPPKPRRKLTCNQTIGHNNNDTLALPLLHGHGACSPIVTPSSFDRTPSRRMVVETSFADLHPLALEADHFEMSPMFAKSGSYHAKPSLLATLRHHKKLDLLKTGEWRLPAPLASPESSLSDASSLSMKTVNCSKAGLTVQKMETIVQSPLPPAIKTSNILSMDRKKSPTSTSTVGSHFLDINREHSTFAESLSEASTRRIGDETKSVSPEAACARSEVSLQELIDAFSSGRSSPVSSMVSREPRHVSFRNSGASSVATTFMEDDTGSPDLSQLSFRMTAPANDHQQDRHPEGPALPGGQAEVPASSSSAFQLSLGLPSQTSGPLSPSSLFLFQKLLSIDSPDDDTD